MTDRRSRAATPNRKNDADVIATLGERCSTPTDRQSVRTKLLRKLADVHAAAIADPQRFAVRGPQ